MAFIGNRASLHHYHRSHIQSNTKKWRHNYVEQRSKKKKKATLFQITGATHMGGESAETVTSLKYQYVHRLKGKLNSQRKGVVAALL